MMLYVVIVRQDTRRFGRFLLNRRRFLHDYLVPTNLRVYDDTVFLEPQMSILIEDKNGARHHNFECSLRSELLN